MDSTIEDVTLNAGENKTEQNFVDEELSVISGEVVEVADHDGKGDAPILVGIRRS